MASRPRSSNHYTNNSSFVNDRLVDKTDESIYIPRRSSLASSTTSTFSTPTFSENSFCSVPPPATNRSSFSSDLHLLPRRLAENPEYRHQPPSSSTFVSNPSPTTYASNYPVFEEPSLAIPSQTANKVATNARHKDAEKRRRDITVSCVQALEIFTRDIHPGVAAGCEVCIDGEATRKRLSRDKSPAPSREGSASQSNEKNKEPALDGLASRMKRPKNDKLEESCMAMYLYVLHHHPEIYPQRLEELKELAKEQKMERERGLREANNDAKLRKWKGDQRSLHTEKLLRQAKELGRTHGIVSWDGAFEANAAKRKRNDSEGHEKRKMSAPTPPSSVTSPASRGATPPYSDDERCTGSFFRGR